jgi:hypothetical protein
MSLLFGQCRKLSTFVTPLRSRCIPAHYIFKLLAIYILGGYLVSELEVMFSYNFYDLIPALQAIEPMNVICFLD